MTNFLQLVNGEPHIFNIKNQIKISLFGPQQFNINVTTCSDKGILANLSTRLHLIVVRHM